MPKSTKELREELEMEFEKVFRGGGFVNERTNLQNPYRIATWWLEKITDRDAELVKTLEGMKKKGLNDTYFCDECGGLEDCDCERYNECIDEIINKVGNTEKI